MKPVINSTPIFSAGYRPDMMEDSHRDAIMSALERLYLSDDLEEIWPGVFDLKRNNIEIPKVEDLDIIVMPLERIGAPSGASGAKVFIAYYSIRSLDERNALLPSPPLVVKVGEHSKLISENEVIEHWPTLSLDVRARFALPIKLDLDNPNFGVLIAPFRSNFQPDSTGLRHGVGLSDLWGLLHQPEELSKTKDPDWKKASLCIQHALESIDHVHRNNKVNYNRNYESTYKAAYEWYLRGTLEDTEKCNILDRLFGSEPTVNMFCRSSANPNLIVKEIFNSDQKFSSTFGPIHGDLHPKNIVVGANDAVRIIDFGWVHKNGHILIDYILLDINLRCTTLPSQTSQAEILNFSEFLDPNASIDKLSTVLHDRARLIKDVIWHRVLEKKLVDDWHSEYLIPFFLVSYGLLLYLDSARNQPAFVATVLAAARLIGDKK
jgi:serine/threonine protein kinase